MPYAVIAALAGAFCFALAAALQHREALGVSDCGVASLGLFLRLGRRPLWLAGVACDLLSMTLHVLALSMATLAVVQPLGVTGIVFAIPLAAFLRKQRIRRLDIVAVTLVVIGLIALLRSLPSSPNVHTPSAWFIVAATAATALLVAGLTFAAHFLPGRPRAILLALGAGTAFGLTAVLVRALILLAKQPGSGPTVVAASLCIPVIGLGGYLLLQSAYRSGHFAASLATSTVTNPLVAVLAGSVLLRETLPTNPGRLIVIGVAALMICAGISLLVRSPAAMTLVPEPDSIDPAISSGTTAVEADRPPVGAAQRG